MLHNNVAQLHVTVGPGAEKKTPQMNALESVVTSWRNYSQ
jgi:IMP dehydrogenase/GMP reductase